MTVQNKKLKQDWLQYGSECFCFIVLEELEKMSNKQEKSFNEDLKRASSNLVRKIV